MGLDIIERPHNKMLPYVACAWGRGKEIAVEGRTKDEAINALSKKLDSGIVILGGSDDVSN
jgi:hypothetical protein